MLIVTHLLDLLYHMGAIFASHLINPWETNWIKFYIARVHFFTFMSSVCCERSYQQDTVINKMISILRLTCGTAAVLGFFLAGEFWYASLDGARQLLQGGMPVALRY